MRQQRLYNWRGVRLADAREGNEVKRMLMLVLMTLMLVLAGCARQPGSPSPTPSPQPSSTPEGVRNQEAATLAAAALLAEELSIHANQVEVHSVEAVDWPDTSLGNPQPGKMYAQVITPGYRVVLRANDALYEVHTDANGKQATLLPPATRPPSGESADDDQPLPDAVDAARQFLSSMLGVPPEEIAVKEVQAVDWPDASLGHPQPGRSYAQVITPGYRILLVAQGRQYDLHTDLPGSRVVLQQ